MTLWSLLRIEVEIKIWSKKLTYGSLVYDACLISFEISLVTKENLLSEKKGSKQCWPGLSLVSSFQSPNTTMFDWLLKFAFK